MNPYKIKAPSIHVENPEITSSIKENTDLINVEVEKNEIILRNDLSAVHKGVGKKHSGGGIKTYVPEGSFIFSDDKSLSFDKDDHEIFELKKGGNFKKRNNTPAKVLERSFKSEDYNSMINKISNQKLDDITKRSAALMLNKYEDTLGKIAFIQEGKKNFPTGIPDIAQNVAPVYDPALKTQIMEQPQYMKKGGYVNPYLPKAALGLDLETDPYLKSNTPSGSLMPTGKSNHYNRGPEYLQSWESVFPGISKMDNKKAQALIYDYTLKNNPEVVAGMWKDAGLTNLGRANADKVRGLGIELQNDPRTGKLNFKNPEGLTNAQLAGLKNTSYTDGMFGYRQLENKQPIYGGEPYPNITIAPRPKAPAPTPIPAPTYSPLGDVPSRNQNIDWAYNPYQKINMAADALQYASVKQEFPYRSQIQSPLVELERMNPNSALNQISNQTSQSYRANQSLNPYIAGANSAQTYGRALDASNQVQSQYDNQNVQIANQQNMVNNQIQKQDQQFNVQADQQYYQQAAEGRKNYDNLKDVAFNNLRSNFNQYTDENRQLAYQLAANPYSATGYNFKTGQFYNTGNRSILDTPSGNAKQENIIDLVAGLRQQGYSDKLIGDIVKSKTIQNWNPPIQKKGGVFKGNPYKKK